MARQTQWRKAAAQLAVASGPATKRQRELASATGISINPSTPTLVASAKLRVALAAELHLRSGRPASELTNEWLARLGAGMRRMPAPETQDEASAWIEHLYLVKRRNALILLKPEPGDIVVLADGTHAELASIGANGRLYFAGGMGQGAWPDSVQIAARVSDTSVGAERLRRAARNSAAVRRPKASWSSARSQELRQFRVEDFVDAAEIQALEDLIEAAADERPIQAFLEKHPSLLGLLLPRSECYVIPQQRLGSQYVPDFVVGDVDSAGIHWHLIELESPKARMFTLDGSALSQKARKGVGQILDWREWLQGNIAYARTSIRDNGLGLFDIRADAPGLVLIGRRASLTNLNEAIRNHSATTQIRIHTYDWFLETLRGSINFLGPAALNPFAFSRQDESDGEMW